MPPHGMLSAAHVQNSFYLADSQIPNNPNVKEAREGGITIIMLSYVGLGRPVRIFSHREEVVVVQICTAARGNGKALASGTSEKKRERGRGGANARRWGMLRGAEKMLFF